jgi:hypothetical protein
MTGTSRMLLAVGVFSAFASQAIAGPCTDRIAEVEKWYKINESGASAATGSIPTNEARATAGNPAPEAQSETSRLPATRPASPDVAAAPQSGAPATPNGTASAPSEQNRVPANRTGSASGEVGDAQANRLPQQSNAAPITAAQAAVTLTEARSHDQAGRESECMQVLTRIDRTAPSR